MEQRPGIPCTLDGASAMVYLQRITWMAIRNNRGMLYDIIRKPLKFGE